MSRLQRMMEGLTQKPPQILRSPLWPRQKCTVAYCPDLEAKPFHDAARFPWIAQLEAAFPKIRAELDALIEDQAGFMKVRTPNGEVTEGQWGSFQLWVHGRPVLENQARCPDTVRALAEIPGRTGLAGFMALVPDSHVLPHYAVTNLKLRGHLGMRIPEKCGMRIDTEVRRWEEGKLMVLDDSFQHEVWNTSDTTRYILLLDFLHPDLSAAEQQAVMKFEEGYGDAAWKNYTPQPGDEKWAAPK